MGSGFYRTTDWVNFSTSRGYHKSSTKTEDIYRSQEIDESLNPLKWGIRESVDSDDNPQSTPVIIGLDVTGSMSPVLDNIARKGLKTICEGIYERKPITNPHICVLGIGDMECDQYPFQATQFEADIRIFEQLEKLYLEGGGGGNSYESYILAWYFAQYRTKIDSYEKRNKKGFIFTIGDEEITPIIKEKHLKRFLGENQAKDFSAKELFDITSIEWDIYHIIIKQGSHAQYNFNKVLKSWSDVIGRQKVIPLDDYTKTGEVITSLLEMVSGKELNEVSSSWDGSTGITVSESLKEVKVSDGIYADIIDNYL